MARKIETEDKKKQIRREVILKVVSEHSLGTQKDLQDELRKNGFDVTQATLSRDIRDLHLVKATLKDGSYGYRLPGNEANHHASQKFYSLLAASVTTVDTALNQVVVHTYTGMAQAVCAALDGLHWENVLGTIAGDDTILVITKNEETAVDVAAALREANS